MFKSKSFKRNILVVISKNWLSKYLHVVLSWNKNKRVLDEVPHIFPLIKIMRTNNQRASGTCDWQLCRPDVLQSRLQTAWAKRVKSAQGT